jgi:hypothetical protein
MVNVAAAIRTRRKLSRLPYRLILAAYFRPTPQMLSRAGRDILQISHRDTGGRRKAPSIRPANMPREPV